MKLKAWEWGKCGKCSDTALLFQDLSASGLKYRIFLFFSSMHSVKSLSRTDFRWNMS